jgi:N utilization substance protein B
VEAVGFVFSIRYHEGRRLGFSDGAMAKRSRAREVALQLLFQSDHNPRVDRPKIESFAHARLRSSILESFCLSLYDGVVAKQAEIDLRLGEVAENWRLPRMAAVDRNVLRMGAYELIYLPETPPSVVLDEAIELARRYGSGDSSAFVNGVLDKLRQVLGSSACDAGGVAGEAQPS